ncbi:hypothetical protein V1283_002752 [Bradyrhizobium sp. AZCC 2262]
MSVPMSKKQPFVALLLLLICTPAYAGAMSESVNAARNRMQMAVDLPTR